MAENKNLLGPTELLQKSWEFFGKKWKTLLGIELLAIAYVFGSIFLLSLPVFIAYTINTSVFEQPIGKFLLVLFGILAFVVITIVASWGQVALILSVIHSDQITGIRQAFQKARSDGILWSFVGLSLLSASIVLTGMFFLVIPGFIFSIWFSQSKYILLDKKTSVFNALATSNFYVNGRFWQVVGRILIISLIFLVIQMVGNLIPFLGMLVSFALAPFGVV